MVVGHRAVRGLVGAVLALTAALGAATVQAPVAQAADTGSTSLRVGGRLAASQVATSSTGRYLVVADRPSLARGVEAHLQQIPGLDVADEPVVGRSIAVEVTPGSEALDEARVLDGVADVVPEVTYSVLDTPDDPAYPDQANSLNVLRLPAAWDLTHGSSDVHIAVLDTGFAVGHPDLAGKVDLFFNSYNGGTSPSDVVPPSAAPDDVKRHGTFVASVAAAATDNAEGLAGAGWNSSIMAVRVANPSGVMTNQALAEGIDWAVENGADVINISLGSDTSDSLTRDAVARAVAANVVVVAAAGNGGTSTKMYPAALPGVLAVGATTRGGVSRAPFSEYGSWVDVGAPGMSIVGANSAYATEDEDYLLGDGTSFAAPLVAGVAGLVRSFRPELTATQVTSAIRAKTNGKDYGFHAGAVDAAALLSSGFTRPAPTVDEPDNGDTVSGEVTVQVSLPDDLDADHVQATLGGSTDTAAVSGGVATLHVSSYGLTGTQTLHVVACKVTVCSPTGTDVAVDVDNVVPVITSPVDGDPLDADFTVSATAAGAPAVRFLADSKVLGTDTSAPFSVDVAISALKPGDHTLTAVVCDAAGKVCATGAPSEPVGIRVDRLWPTISSAKPSPFSPNGDGQRDTVVISFTVDVPSQVRLRVQDGAAADVRTWNLGQLAAGAHSVVWGGKSDAGVRLPSGAYTLLLDTTATPDTVELHGSASAALTIDLAAPKVSGASSTYPIVYPYNDGYRESTTLSISSAEDTSAVAVYVYNSKGKAVWSATKSNAPAGKVGVKFTGHSSTGAKLPSGSYTYQFRVRDTARNLTVSDKHTVKVSWKKLVSRTFTKTLTAVASGNGSYLHNPGDSSYVAFSPWASGALLWDAVDGPVLTIHHVTLPASTIAAKARVSTYARGRSGTYAELSYLLDDGETLVGATGLGTSTGTHRGSAVQVSASLLHGRQLQWVMAVDSGGRYEAKTFTITYNYQVLA